MLLASGIGFCSLFWGNELPVAFAAMLKESESDKNELSPPPVKSGETRISQVAWYFQNGTCGAQAIVATYGDQFGIPQEMALRFGLDSGTLGQLDATLRTTRIAHPFLCNVADTETAYTYEMGTRDMIRRGDIHEGIQVVCNTPIDSYWSDVSPSETSKNRRENLLTLGEKYKGSIDLECMKRIMETPYSQGGATVPTTIYQFVYEPDQRMLHIRIPGHREWTPIPLKRFFVND